MDSQIRDVTAPIRPDFKPTSSPRSASAQGFFNTPPQLSQPQMQVVLDPATFLLLTAILKELKIQNDISLAKLQREAEQKQESLELAEQGVNLDMETDKRFEEISHSMYM